MPEEYVTSIWIINHTPSRFNDFRIDVTLMRKLLKPLPVDSEAYSEWSQLCDELENDESEQSNQLKRVDTAIKKHGAFIDACWRPIHEKNDKDLLRPFKGMTVDEFLGP